MNPFETPHGTRLVVVAVAAVAVAVLLSLVPRLASQAQASQPASAMPAGFVWQGPAPIADEVDWSRIEATADTGPLAVAAY